MLKVKAGVEFTRVAPAGYRILEALRLASRTMGRDLTITSGTDGAHSGATDPHKTGEAFDVRSHDLLPEDRERVLALLVRELGWDRFYVSLEGRGTANEHFHLQRKMGTTYTVADYLGA
jgi:hypothetical protein